MTTAAASDPFESTANPAHYVPRPASDAVLEELERRVRDSAHPVALTGPVGLGKTFLMQVLAHRLAGAFRVVWLPYPALSAAELCGWVLDALGLPVGEDPEGALLDCAFRTAGDGREILVMIDDASALPLSAARHLATLVSASGGALRAVFAGVDDARLGAVVGALGPDLHEIRYDAPMTADQTAAYVRARLAHSSDAERARRFDADAVARIHGAAAGIPRRVHELASLVWRTDGDDHVASVIERWARADQDRDDEPLDDRIDLDESEFLPGASAAASREPDADEAAALAAAVDLGGGAEEREPRAGGPGPPPARTLPSGPTSRPEPEQTPTAIPPATPPAVSGTPRTELPTPPPAREIPPPAPRASRSAHRGAARSRTDAAARARAGGGERRTGPRSPRRDRRRSRTRAAWLAVASLGVLAVAMPYLLQRIEDLLPAGPERPRVRVGPAAVPPEPGEGPGLAPTLEAADEGPAPGAGLALAGSEEDEARAELDASGPVSGEPGAASDPGGSEPLATRSSDPGGSEPLATRSSDPGGSEPLATRSSDPGGSEPLATRSSDPGGSEPLATRSSDPGGSEPLATRSSDPGADVVESSAPRATKAAPEPTKPQAPARPPPVAVVRPEPPPATEPGPVASEPSPPVRRTEPEPGPVAKAPAPSSPPAPRPPAPAPVRRAAQPEPVLVNIHAIPWATVHVDGDVVGETPLVALPLAPGLHVFRAEFPGGRAVVRTVEISSENRHVSFE